MAQAWKFWSAPNPQLGSTPTIHDTQTVDGETWSVSTYPETASGETCGGLNLLMGGFDAARGTACTPTSTMFANGPIVVHLGAGQQRGDPTTQWAHIWVWGYAAPSVARLELQLTNCTTVPLPVDSSGVFLNVTSTETIASGVGPQAVIAYGADGQILATVPTVIDAPHSVAGEGPGIHPVTPTPGATAPTPETCS